ncbi:MAG: phosphoenolpyruvate-protein phosphotransferase PtsP [Proteobacteria bacterium]|nr:MAG: phosphoenolpyruvate-protein phosphotransferase PtsP [Pseudomonadota bacterium]
MLEVLRKIVQEVNDARDLGQVLDIILRRVQETLSVDVCSVYLSNHQTRQNMLMATVGLNPEAVGKVRLSFDEGIVGRVTMRAEPINLDDAPQHPNYKYIPESGEDPYHAFVGVPIIHQRDVMGVLVVQQRARRRFDDNDVSFLVTLAAHIAGAIGHAAASGQLPSHSDTERRGGGWCEGQSGAPGVGVGWAVEIVSAADLRSVPDRTTDSPEAEVGQFLRALSAVREEIKRLRVGLGEKATEAQALFDAYLMLLSGEGIEDDTVARIRAGSWAPGALRAVIDEHARVFAAMDDPYLRERAEDIRDLGARILLRLRSPISEKARDYPAQTVLIGGEITAAQLIEVPHEKLVAVVSGRGSTASHIAILARALGVPAVMGTADLPTGRLHGEEIIVDGYLGRVYVRPQATLRREYVRLAREEQELVSDLQGLRDQPSVTSDGVHLPLFVNTSLLSEIEPALRSGTGGVGLYRTEIPFLVRDRFPAEEEQLKSYRHILEVFHPRPVTLRTLDIGGDKPLPYFSWEEENPFLGWRGIRVTLDHPEIFRVQLRAMLRADIGLGNMRVMFPMISTVEELEEAVHLIDETIAELRVGGLDATRPPIGAMIEVPSTLYMIEELARLVDFFSVGTNDLTQYLLAVDRNNPRVAKMFKSLHPAVLRALAQLIDAAHRAGKPISVCGEIAGDPAGALLLLGLGIDGLSMNVASLPRIKWLVRSFSRAEAEQLAQRALRMGDVGEVHLQLNTAIEMRGLGGLIRAGR